MENLIIVPIALAVLGLVFMLIKMAWVKKQNAGNERMQEISKNIKEGALAFLSAEYRLLAIFVVIASAALFGISTIVETTSWMIVPAFIIGAVFSALAGNIGMRIATEANARTTEAARTSLPQALKVSFGGGTVMGLGVAGLAVLGLSLFFMIFVGSFMGQEGSFYQNMTMVLEALAGFSLGAESIALFARVGGGIYTKAADVGADLVGKVEAGIPEDDPRNPATIADNVGDNVGDVAGMGADLFGSYVATVLASMVLGNYIIKDMLDAGQVIETFNGMGAILLPIMIAGAGIVASIIGTFLIKVKDNSAKEAQVQRALNTGNITSILLTIVACWFLIDWMLPETIMGMKFFGEGTKDVPSINVFYATLVGLGVGYLISMFTEYYTALGKKPVLDIVKNSSTGAATNIIAGLATGMISTFSSVILFAAAIWGSYALAGFYGVALAASAMMATTAMQLAIDAFGPIADNAGGVAEMSELPDEVRERTDILDSVGNTTAAVGKGFAIASAALTALALFAAYVTFTGIDGINIFRADVLSALFIGGMIPVVFSALAMKSVGKAAMDMVMEVRRQFKEIPGIMEGTGTPEYGKCVEISTKAALREMMLPGAITIVTPIIIGFAMGAEALGAYMAGVAVSGVLWAIFQNNAGGAWDNAKKSFEAGVEINGEMTYKGSDAHKAAVTGDTVGDPFKDTSGPSMNILIKLTCLVGLVIAPILGGHTAHSEEKTEEVIEVVEETPATPESEVKSIAGLTGMYKVDEAHTFVNFEIRHLFSNSRGTFGKVSGNVNFGENPSEAKFDIVIDAKTIDTRNEKRDDHLRSEDFFEVKKYKTINFKGNGLVQTENGYDIPGTLTIKDVTKEVVVKAEFLGNGESPFGSEVAAFAGSLTIDRNDYGITFMPGVLGNEVEITFTTELIKQ
ncbi:sodium-translocating pyrophosphatase [Luteibaculum oceani]|uniref:Putative K(+)-stimulated pyrophosphate-energized sodium pump n=1 Tax=Luteibaculum oceani TaxID=1294296 RepID=A0A5C6V1P1_9FLAO|nr:sodium-translocating pyrophosphatase [Luteibaculum oceani]TXC78316.1 sodium-translocating pyrophosphatase [Luteibaculum oceani]